MLTKITNLPNIEPMEDQKPLVKKLILVQGIETKDGETNGKKWTLLTLKDDKGDRYTFFKTKVDGSESKAFEAVKTGKVALYQKTGIAFNEEEYKYVNKKTQEPATSMNRRVAFFFDADDIQAQQVIQQEVPTEEVKNASDPKTEDIPF